ncbi:MAG: superoxide dismutase family protein [Hyphomicrobiaceae bacterium]
MAQMTSGDADMLNNKGEKIGVARLSSAGKATVIRLTLKAGALSPGWHGIHLHRVGDCSDHASFQASKGHISHGSEKHGLLNPEGPEDGDLPNIHVAQDGSVTTELAVNLPLEGDNGLKQGDGSALVIHANPDDHKTQPIGGAGARVACGAIK